MTTSTPGELWAGLSAGEREALAAWHEVRWLNGEMYDLLSAKGLVWHSKELDTDFITDLGRAVLAAGTPQATPAPTGERLELEIALELAMGAADKIEGNRLTKEVLIEHLYSAVTEGERVRKQLATAHEEARRLRGIIKAMHSPLRAAAFYHAELKGSNEDTTLYHIMMVREFDKYTEPEGLMDVWFDRPLQPQEALANGQQEGV